MTSAPVRTANLFVLHGRFLHISYSASGIDGKPRFTYQDQMRTLSFSGDEITSEPVAIGTLVTVTVVRTVDSGSTAFSVLLPHVNLDADREVPISTEGVTTLRRFSLVPALQHGQTDLYTVVRLTGTAAQVDF